MTTNGNNLEPEFDALLKSQVKMRGTSNVSVCHQFDPDTANAYLERELTKNAQVTYEEHLAGCPSCRRYIIELSRLMPTPTLAAEPIIAPMPFKERLSLWFTGWRWGALVGLGAVAATILVIAVIVNRPGQEMLVATSQSHDQVGISQPAPISSPPSETAMVDTAAKANVSATPAATAGAGDRQVETTAKSLPEQPQIAAAPPPPPAPVSKTEEERKEVAANQVGQIGGLATAQNQQRNFRELPLSGPAVNQAQTDRAGERARQEPVAAPGANAPAPVVKPMERSVEKDKQVESKVVADARRDDSIAKKSSDTDEQLKPAKSKAQMRPALVMGKNERLARPVRNVGGKSFHLESGIWTDAEYDAGKGLPVTRLQHDSDEYKQTLKDIPGLKPYFDLNPVIVVWQGKVYRIEKK